MDFQPITKSKDQINADAESFLNTYHASMVIPIPIEEIIEIQLGMDIIPIPGLKDISEQAGLDIDAFIGSDFRDITVDEYIFKKVGTRYRFSLAHEIGHMVLHGYLYTHLKFHNTDEWINLLNEMPKYERDIVEWQANEFAGLLLVPQKILIQELDGMIKENEQRFKKNFLNKKGLPYETSVDLAIYPLSLKFNVSENVMKLRLRKDGLVT